MAIPISIYTTKQDNVIPFKQLHKEDNLKIKHKSTCSHCGKKFNLKAYIKDFGYVKDHCVVVTDNDLITLLKKTNWNK